MLESALAAGMAAAGADVFLGGVLPTPAAAILVRKHGFDLGAVVSASHNPWRDNGIKFFGRDGRKLDDDAEARVEARVAAGPATGSASGRIRKLEGALDDYLRALATALRPRPHAAAGSSSTARTAPPTAPRRPPSSASAPTSSRSRAEPDGRNINEGCGSTHLENVAAAVAEHGAEIGFAFDGDGDRMLAVDAEGREFDGDEIVALAALHLREVGELPGGIAVTVMSNYGFHQAMEAAGIEVATTKVGDRLRDRGAARARLDDRRRAVRAHHLDRFRGDRRRPRGRAARHAGARRAAARGAPADREAPAAPRERPGARVARRSTAATGLWEAVGREGARLEGRGRVLVRPSGTEPLVRVMVEAPDEAECEEVLGRLVDGRAAASSADRPRSRRLRRFARIDGVAPYPSSPFNPWRTPCAASSDMWAGGHAATC